MNERYTTLTDAFSGTKGRIEPGPEDYWLSEEDLAAFDEIVTFDDGEAERAAVFLLASPSRRLRPSDIGATTREKSAHSDPDTALDRLAQLLFCGAEAVRVLVDDVLRDLDVRPLGTPEALRQGALSGDQTDVDVGMNSRLGFVVKPSLIAAQASEVASGNPTVSVFGSRPSEDEPYQLKASLSHCSAPLGDQVAIVLIDSHGNTASCCLTNSRRSSVMKGDSIRDLPAKIRLLVGTNCPL